MPAQRAFEACKTRLQRPEVWNGTLTTSILSPNLSAVARYKPTFGLQEQHRTRQQGVVTRKDAAGPALERGSSGYAIIFDADGEDEAEVMKVESED